MIRKLRTRFVLFNMFVVTVLLAVMTVIIYAFNWFSLRSQSIDTLHRAAAMSIQRADPAGEMPEELTVAWLALGMTPEGQLRVWGSDHFDLSDRESLLVILDEAASRQEDTGVLRDRKLRYYRTETLTAFTDMTTEEVVMGNIRTSCLLMFGISWCAFFLVSLLLSYITARPVEVAWEQQRQFIADASHELKTPLSVIMANAELLQSVDREAQEPYAGNILTMSYQMRSLVERMLELARVDSISPELKPLDFSQLVEDAALSVQLLYEEQGRDLKADIQEGLFVKGSESQLYQLLDVLLDNALKYSQGPGPVELSLKAQGGSCQLAVTSPGQALTAQQQKDVFKRFYRGDAARSSGGGYGLGLAIAQGVVNTHRGTIRAQGEDGHNTFLVALPTCQKP